VFFTEYGDYARAIQLTQQALEIDQKIGEAASEFVTRSNLGYSFVQLGMFDAGCVELEKSIKTAEKAGARRNLAYSRLNLGLAHLRSSNYPLACQMVDRAIQELEEVGDEFGQAAGLSYLALAQEGLGEITQALHHFQQAQEIHDRIGIIAYAQDARAGVARCTLAVGTLESAKQQANQLWDYLTQHSSRGMEFPILAYLTCAEVFQAAGEANRYQAALEAGYRDLMERAEKISDPEWRDSYLLNIPEHIKTIRLYEMMESAPLNRPDGLADPNPESS
jgi:tetratricopeptide (TPR) repeat protein